MNLRARTPRDGHASRYLRVALVLVASLVACASPPPPLQPAPVSIDTVVLLPATDGLDTALIFTQDGHSTVIAQPYAAARTGPQGPQTFVSNAADVEARFGAARAALPARPASFMVFFVEGRDVLTEESRVAVEKVFAEIATRPAPDVLVVGHTDRVGSIPSNDALSLLRAETIRAELMRRGIAAENILATGRGERESLVPTADDVAEPRNRRVEIIVR